MTIDIISSLKTAFVPVFKQMNVMLSKELVIKYQEYNLRTMREINEKLLEKNWFLFVCFSHGCSSRPFPTMDWARRLA